MKILKGIYPALITPFNADGSLNEDALKQLVEMNLNKGVQGFYVSGSTGEAFLLSPSERKRILEIVTGQVNGRCTVIAHVGCIATEQAIEFALHAKEAGADAVSAIPPFYYKFSFDEVRDYYFDIAAAVRLPMIVYNFPALSGVDLSTQNILELRGNKYIAGIKHTSMNLYQVERMKALDKELLVLNGHDEVFLAGLSMGADGAIGSTFNFMAEKFIEIEGHFKEGKFAEARQGQEEANEIIAVLIKTGVFQGIKYILDRMGVNCGQCRKPMRKLADEDKKLLDAVIEKL